MSTRMPADSILYLEAPGLGSVLEAGLEHPLIEQVLASELGMALVDQSDVSLAQKLKFVDAIFGEPVLDALQRASERGVGLSVSLRKGLPATMFCMQGADAKSTEKTLKRLFQLMQKSGFDAKPRSLGLAEMWPLKDGAVLAKVDSLLIIATTEELAREGLALALEQTPRGLNSNPNFVKVMGKSSASCTFRGWIDSNALEAADPKKFEWMDQLQHTPEGQLLLGAGISTLTSSDAMGVSLDLGANAIDLRFWGADLEWPVPLGAQHADGQFSKPVEFLNMDVLGQALLYRDIETFLAERPNLLLPRDLPGVSEALTTFSLFFGGMDFGEEISPELSPWIHVVCGELEYEAGPQPNVKFPGVALICELKNPEVSGQQWNTAFQSLIGMLNIDAAQKKGGRGSMLLGLGLEGDTVISHASYPNPAEGEPVDARYNLRPSCCVVAGRLVIGSHEDLVRQVVRALKAQSEAAPQRSALPLESLKLSIEPISRLVQANFDTLVMSKVVDDGVSFEKATEELTGLALALKAIGKLELRVDYSDPESIVASLHLALKPAGGKEQ